MFQALSEPKRQDRSSESRGEAIRAYASLSSEHSEITKARRLRRLKKFSPFFISAAGVAKGADARRRSRGDCEGREAARDARRRGAFRRVVPALPALPRTPGATAPRFPAPPISLQPRLPQPRRQRMIRSTPESTARCDRAGHNARVGGTHHAVASAYRREGSDEIFTPGGRRSLWPASGCRPAARAATRAATRAAAAAAVADS